MTESRDHLLTALPKGTTVYTILRHVSRSGTLRAISLAVAEARLDGTADISLLDYHVRQVLDLRYHAKHGGLVVHGAGMDMGFHLVYELSQALHGDGYALNHRWL